MAKTELPKAYDPTAVESRWYRFWEEQGYFHAEPDPARERYCITIPPPNVTGELHMGHALNHTIHDLLLRWHRMMGRVTVCIPGTDHAGISTQIKVEQRLQAAGTSRHDIGRDAFLVEAWKWKEEYGGAILRQLRALGCSYDWERERFTLDPGYVKAVMTAFLRFYDRGWIYRDSRMVNWCPRCQTVISDLEVEHRDVNDHLWHIRYRAAHGGEGVVVATTRPETLLGDVAVAVHPEDPRYADLIDQHVILPLTPFSRVPEIPVIGDAQVDPEFGTGALKITPYHDPNDYDIARRHPRLKPLVDDPWSDAERAADADGDLRDVPPNPTLRVILKDGRMSRQAGERYAGLDRYEARKLVLADLEAAGLLVKTEAYTHAVGHHDKCGTVIEPVLSQQWFLDMRKLAAKAKATLVEDEVTYYPPRFLEYTVAWLDGIQPWCLSRQLWWGHRIPVWWCAQCGEETPGSLGEAGEVIAPDHCRVDGCDSVQLEQDPDVLDTWFSSALWPFAVLGWPESETPGTPEAAMVDYFHPTDILITARDILYLWVVRMVMTSLEIRDEIPFRAVFVHPTIMDPSGRRMSKSLGTGVDPMGLIAKYGTDATRFGLIYQCATGQDVRFSEDRFEMSRNFCNKIWNASRFLLMNMPEGETVPALGDGVPAGASLADRWILSRFAAAANAVNRSLDEFRMDEAARALYEFFWGEFCDWYVELAKPALRSDAPEDQTRTRSILCGLLEATLRLLHPFMPFISEEIWQQLPVESSSGRTSIMTAPWPGEQSEWSDPIAETEMASLAEVVAGARRLRARLGVEPGRRVAVSVASESATLMELLRANTEGALTLMQAASLELRQGPLAEGAAPASERVGEGEMRAEVTIEVTVSAEERARDRERALREREKIATELERLAAKLANPNFVERAPAEVVEKVKAEQAELQARWEALGDQAAASA